ncbi:hypothetical protein Syun_023634 [Stephania yunnanensis]|uniref:Uncharacterized protein n=1 Tax=Stephania yunnanensis TaxID=152371 RepID=A0AAP0HZT2_9MAGN
MCSKNSASIDSIIEFSLISEICDLTTKNLYAALFLAKPMNTQSTVLGPNLVLFGKGIWTFAKQPHTFKVL